MHRRRLLSLLLASLALSGCTRVHRQNEVFAWYLKSILKDVQVKEGPKPRPMRLVVEAQVSVESTFFSSENLSTEIKELSTLHPSAITDLLLNRDSTSRVRLPASLMPPTVTVDYVSAHRYDAIFTDDHSLGDAWRAFYKAYPGSGGLLTFSPVGFSADGNQAVFALALRCGGLCGSGHMVLMQRTLDGWVEAEGKRLWVS